jgi:signal transduction histidine kinase
MSPRVRVTLAFTAILAAVLTAAGVYIYARASGDIQEAQDRGLRSRAADLVAIAGSVSGTLPSAPGIESDEDVAQVLTADGRVIASSAGAQGPLVRRAGFADGHAGDERVRLFAEPVGGRLVVVGASHDEVAEDRTALLLGELAGLGGALLVGAVGAWLLAGAVVRPVAAALEREQRFVADASHELRTPLTNLKAELEVTRMEGGDPARVLASVEQEVDRLRLLADDLLLLARDEGLRRTDVELDAVLARAARGYAVERAPTGLSVHADGLRLEQAVRNLIDNAARHGAPPVKLTADRADGVVTVRVRDHGGGPGNGSGFGLQIVDRIAKAHDGSARLVPADPGTTAELVIRA